jgi:hypothetical protein
VLIAQSILSDLRNGSRHCLRKKRRRSSKMCHSWCCLGEHACVTSSSTKVRELLHHQLNKTVPPTTVHVLTRTFSIDSKVVYRRYASLFFIAGCASTDNELITLEIVHRYVEQMDKYYGNVCELDIIFNFQKAYFILDELLLAGEMQESSKKNVLRCISQEDSLEDMEVSLKDIPLLSRIIHIWDVVLPGVPPVCAQPPQTNSIYLPFRSRKRSRKLGERLAQQWLFQPLRALPSMNPAALCSVLI